MDINNICQIATTFGVLTNECDEGGSVDFIPNTEENLSYSPPAICPTEEDFEPCSIKQGIFV